MEARFFSLQDASLARHADKDVETRLFALIQDLSAFIFAEAQGAFYKRCLLFPPEPMAAAIRAVNERSEARIDAALGALFKQGEREQRWKNLTNAPFWTPSTA